MSAPFESGLGALAVLGNEPRVERRPLRVALLGLGTVGSSVARILFSRPELADRLVLTHIFNRNVARKRSAWELPSVAWTDSIDDVLAAQPDLVVETAGGVEPAYSWVSRALAQGASVVTANKMLMAAHGPELIGLAAASGSQLRFEASVAGGVPLINGIREGLAGDVLERVAGILNGTCNYVLSRMGADDVPMDVVLEDARRLGYAEADPSFDVDGHDAVAKLVVLAGIAFQRHLRSGDVPVHSIRPVSPVDFRYASRLDGTIRQVSLAEQAEDGGLHAWVGPAVVPRGTSFGRNDGANNVVTVVGRYGGPSTFSGAGAGGDATAVAIVSDLLALGDRARGERPVEWQPAACQPAPRRPYYLRFVVKDRPGILASFCAALGRRAINVDAVLQEPGYPKDALPFVVTVEPCEEVAMRSAVQEIAAGDVHAEPPLVMPMLFGEQ